MPFTAVGVAGGVDAVVTVIFAVPVTVELEPDEVATLAVIVAEPAATAVTNPELLTVATAEFEDDQVAVGVAVLPSELVAEADSCFVCATVKLAVEGVTETINTVVAIVPPPVVVPPVVVPHANEAAVAALVPP